VFLRGILSRIFESYIDYSSLIQVSDTQLELLFINERE